MPTPSVQSRLTSLRDCRRTLRSVKSFIANRRSYRTVFSEDDIVLLRKKGDDAASPILTKPLHSSGKVETARGRIYHSDIIGKAVRDVISVPKKNVEYRLHQPTLAEYVTLTPRIVTPVYPADANLIISLLDLHPTSNAHSTRAPLEIFEAGTGHGALTLYLARAIHGANDISKPLPVDGQNNNSSLEEAFKGTTNAVGEAGQEVTSNPGTGTALGNDIDNRSAMIHTLDISERNSKHARSIVRNFRRGLYYHNIDFHVGTIPEYISARLTASDVPFLDHIILDLPGPHTHFEILSRATRANGSMVVFCPSITQIISCVKLVKEQHLPFLLEQVVEIGVGAGVGGREWDVRAVRPRAVIRAEMLNRSITQGVNDETPETDTSTTQEEHGSGSGLDSDGWEMVARPKVAQRLIGGGFVGLWRRMERRS